MSTNMEQIDISQLLAEAGAEVDALIKAERTKLEALSKKEESSKEELSKEESSMKKEESSKEESSMKKKEAMAHNKANGDVQKKEESSMKKEESSMKKDEGSGYENQAPEASDDAGSHEDAPPSPEGSEDPQQGEDLNSMVSSLDDEMLHELMQVVQMEMQARQEQQSPDESQPPMEDPAAQQSQSAPPPMMGKMESAYKSELSAVQEKLAKSETEASNLYKSVSAMTELMDKMINRPVTKAVTDIRHIDYVDKGEKDLKKSETENISDADLQKQAKALAMDNKRLSTLVKNERDVLSDFLVNKKRSPEILKLIAK